MRPEPGLKEMVEESLELARENNRLLRKMRRNAILGGFLRIIWWAAIIGVPLYLYLTVLQPYLDALGAEYEGLREQVEEFQNIPQNLESIFRGSEE